MMQFDLKNEKRRLKKWLEKKDLGLDSPMRSIEEKLAKKLSPGITVYINSVGAWHANNANDKILNGDSSGWVEMRKCFDYHACSIRILSAYQEIGRYGWMPLSDVATWLTFAIAFRDDSFATWLGDRLVKCLTARNDRYQVTPPSPFFLAFIQFFAVWKKIEFDIKRISNGFLGIYQEVLDQWSDEPSYLKAVMAACDYHVAQMHEEEGYSEFLAAPENLLPVEMLMFRRIRQDQQLPNPDIDHPLMQTPLGKAPETLPEIKDQLLEQILAKARKELVHFPEF